MGELERKGNPLPRGPLLALAGVFMTNALSSTVLLPFAAFMVDSFHVTDDRNKLGYYAGFLASSFSFGLLCSSIFWGILSDRIGRRPVLLFGLANNFVCALCFGFSVNFRMAILTRFFNGLLTGVSGVGKTAVSEITNSGNQASGFSVIGVCWGIGLLFGPALGGFLCQPVDKYPFIPIFHKGSLFDDFPYALPCIVLAALTAVGFLVVFRYLPETKGLAKAVGGEEEGRRLVPMGSGVADGKGFGDERGFADGTGPEEGKGFEKRFGDERGFGNGTGLENGKGFEKRFGDERGSAERKKPEGEEDFRKDGGGVEMEGLDRRYDDEEFKPLSLEVIVDGSKDRREYGAESSEAEGLLGPHAKRWYSLTQHCQGKGLDSSEMGSSLPQEGGLLSQTSDVAARSRRSSLEVTALAVESAGAGLQGLALVTPTFDPRECSIFRDEEDRLTDWKHDEYPPETASSQNGVLSKLSNWVAGRLGKRKQYRRVKSHQIEITGIQADGGDLDDNVPSTSNSSFLSQIQRFFALEKDAPGQSQKGGLVKAMCEKEILVCLVVYCMLSFIYGAFDEIFPLWSLTDWHSGGLNFGTNNVGMAQTAGGVALIPFQLFAYPWLAKRVGPLHTMRIGMCAGVLLTFIPLVRLVGHDRTLVQVAASGALMVRSISSLCVFTSIFILLTNAVSDPRHLGGMNGIAASAAAVSRAFAPTAGGSVFAWSVGQHGVFPLDYHLPFLITGAFLSVALAISIVLPKSIDERKFVTM